MSDPTLALLIALAVTMLVAVVLGCLCVMLRRDNDKLRHRAWDRLKTANRLRNMRLTHRLLEDFVNDPIGDVEIVDADFVKPYLRSRP